MVKHAILPKKNIIYLKDTDKSVHAYFYDYFDLMPYICII